MSRSPGSDIYINQQGAFTVAFMTFSTQPSSLWVIKPGSLGDIVHALPCLAAIRNYWPQIRTTWVVDPRWSPLLENNPAIDERLLFQREDFRGVGGIWQGWQWIRALKNREKKPDICIDLQGLLRSALMARFSGARQIVGFSEAREGSRFFYHRVVRAPEGGIHAVDRYLSVLSAFGIERPDKLEFPLPAGSEPVGFPLSSDWVLLHPFARGEGKSLSEPAVVRFCEQFDALPIVIAGMGKFSSKLPSHCSVLLNQTSLQEMIWLCRHARFTLSVDSGPIHIAAAVPGARLLALHTRTDPRRVGPYSSEAWIWQGGEIRRQNLSPNAPILSPRSPDFTDIDRIAAWLRTQLSGL